MSKTNVIITLSILLVCSTLLAAYALISKGKATPAVTMVLKEGDYIYESESNYNSSKFWNNYPFWVMLSEGRQLHPKTNVTIDGNQDALLSDLVRKGPALFLKMKLSQVDMRLADTTLRLAKDAGLQVYILTDMASQQLLANKALGIKPGNICLLNMPLNLDIERSALPYFFQLSKDLKVHDIYVPRIEIPEVTARYLLTMKSINDN